VAVEGFEWKRNPPKNFNNKDEALFETQNQIIIPEMEFIKKLLNESIRIT